jgi:hypothetical protein
LVAPRLGRATYQTVRDALMDTKASYAKKDFEVFLQGSYGNETNIYAESDVDTVIRLDSIWRSDLSDLPQEQQDAYHRSFGKATYTFDEFKKAVVTRLSNAFGTGSVSAGNKAIKIAANASRRSADVVACYQHRSYHYFISPDDQGFTEGVIFPTQSSGEIINYPKQHSENCTAKHQATKGWFKPMVRIVKNLRTRMVEKRMISTDTGPSYYIDGMLWNVPDDQFGGTFGDALCNCINWLRDTDRSKLKCAHEQYLLLGNSNVQWAATKCDFFLNAIVTLWNQG